MKFKLRLIRRLAAVGACLALSSGCVVGSGPCSWLNVKHNYTGHVHFRDYRSADGIDNVPVLALDKTEYVYAPAQSFHCMAANDVQLIGVTEFPERIGENAHVNVEGRLIEGVAQHEYTRFLINVISISPVGPPQ
jgi:hypothetical protein